MNHLPLYIPVTFILTVLITLFLFYRASGSLRALGILLAWAVLQSVLSFSGFYQVLNTTPPRFPLIVLPPLIAIVLLLTTRPGKRFTDSQDLSLLTLMHTVRIPIELVLLWLFVRGGIPQMMTFEGRNFDILSGLSAPVVYYFGFVRKSLSRTALISWNGICLLLVINIAANGLLSAQTPFQQFAFEQPNVAVTYFPYVLLPALVVPLVIFAHLTAIRQLWSKSSVSKKLVSEADYKPVRS